MMRNSKPMDIGMMKTDYSCLQPHLQEAARLLKAMSNDIRLKILCLLSAGELSVAQVNAQIDISQSALSQHLAVLRGDGLVKTRRSSQTIFYRLAEGPALQMIATLHSIYCKPHLESHPKHL